MTTSRTKLADRARRFNPTPAAFLFGLPLAAGIVAWIHRGPMRQTPAFRYVEHPVEWVEAAMFGAALAILLAKYFYSWLENAACRRDLLPRYDGKPEPVEKASGLLFTLENLPRWLKKTFMVRRLSSVLDFLTQRRSTAGLDDQLRSLADNDAMALESSYSLTRFITWAIPILGFLGTVIGITGAIAGVSPEHLEEGLSQVTDGLAEAFDCTALALGLTMILMFLSSLVEKREQAVLERVDNCMDQQIAHRFVRDGGVSGEPVVAAMGALVEQLVQRQADLWAKSLAEPERQLTAALAKAMEQTLQTHAQRMTAMEQQTLAGMNQLLQQVQGLTQAVANQAAALAKLQEDESNLVHLQAVLHQNLATLASASNFEQAVHGLTAVAHLLTARMAGTPNAQPATVPMNRGSQAKAA
jgi:biopolymer transport protein ExbB/TolQ